MEKIVGRSQEGEPPSVFWRKKRFTGVVATVHSADPSACIGRVSVLASS